MTGHFKNVLSAEIDPYAAKTYSHLFGDDPTNDLTSEKFKHEVENTKYDVLLAGFPCQTFSSVGKKMGFRDITRGTIFLDIAEIISKTNPSAVFLENVENLVSHDHGNTIKTIIRTLEEELGYKIIGVSKDKNGNYVYSRSTLVRNTKDFGLPQNRPRTYLIAFSKNRYGIALDELDKQLPSKREEVIFRDVIEVLEPEVDDRYYMSRGYLDTLKKHRKRQKERGNGFGYCIVNQGRGDHPLANTILATGGSGKERNLVYQPKPGISGKPIAGKRTELNSDGIRIMTPTEWGRLQGFVGYAFLNKHKEDMFSFPEGTKDGQKYKQLGNSVSIPVIRSMAEFMLDCFNAIEEKQKETIRLLVEKTNLIIKKDVMDGLDINSAQASVLLNALVDSGKLLRFPKGRGTYYTKSYSCDHIE